MRAARLFKRLLGFDAVSVIAVDVVAEKGEQIVVVNLARPCVQFGRAHRRSRRARQDPS